MSTIGEYLKNLRGGISIRAVADATGISNAYLSQLEGGKRENPHPEILKKLAKYYSIPMIEMLKQAGYLEEDEEPQETYLEKMGIKGLINGLLISLVIWILILIPLIFLAGCSGNPFGPELVKDYKDFQQFLAAMDSPEEVSEWIQTHTHYDRTPEVTHGESEGDNEVDRKAKYLFDKRRGACLQQACLFALVNRINGYTSGIVLFIPQHIGSGHAWSWFVGKSGKVSITSNDTVSRNIYDNLKHMLDCYIEVNEQLMIYDSKMEKVLYSYFVEESK